jgi:hypothetical protein
MILKPLAFLGIGLAGWLLGRARPTLNMPIFALALFAVISAHSGVQWAFLDGRLDQVFGDPRTDAPEAVIVLIAGGEAVGLWLPWLLLPWAPVGARFSAALYGFAASLLAAVYHYFPFDLMVMTDELIAPEGPPYLLAFVACLPMAAVGFLMGWLKSHTAIKDDWAPPGT